MPAADLAPLQSQQASQHTRTGEGILQVQPIETLHDRQIGGRYRARQRLLSAAPGIGRRSGGHAASRSAAPGVSLRRFAYVARPAGFAGVQDRPPACEDANEADGDRGALSPSAHHQARARPQDLSVSAARYGDHAAEPSLGDVATMQVHCADITYIPMARGFVYLAVVLDWATRRVLSWRLSITMEAAFCVETLEDALARHGRPDIFNTDQGSQFTGSVFTGMLTNHDIAISMDGKGAWRDNVFVERLWRSVKYEEVYLRAYETVGEAQASIGRYLDFYNGRRPHSSLDGRTPDQAYFNSLPLRLAA